MGARFFFLPRILSGLWGLWLGLDQVSSRGGLRSAAESQFLETEGSMKTEGDQFAQGLEQMSGSFFQGTLLLVFHLLKNMLLICRLLAFSRESITA